MLLLVVDVVAENLIPVSQPRTHCLTDYQQFRKTERQRKRLISHHADDVSAFVFVSEVWK